MNRFLFGVFLMLVPILSYSSSADPYNCYQWNRQEANPWYEWWYYKVVLPETGESFYAVYGVVNPWDQRGITPGTRSYVSFGNFSDRFIVDKKFPVDQFSASYESTDVRVAGNTATDRIFEGQLQDDVYGEQKWSVHISKNWSFNAMGWAMQVPGLLNISWYPAQADATCSGTIESNGKIRTFTNAPCYQDRNWGTSFPDWWTWIVSNNFHEEKDATLAIGGGMPEILGKKIYSGVSVGFRFRGKQYFFRPNDLNRVKSKIKWGQWTVVAKNPELKLEIEATAPSEKFMDIQFVTPTGEVFHDYETLTGHLSVKVYKRKDPGFSLNSYEFLTVLTSDQAGIEYGSKNLQQLLSEKSEYENE